MSETRSTYLKHPPERDPGEVRDERIDVELEKTCIICGETEMWDDRFCHYCAKEHYS